MGVLEIFHECPGDIWWVSWRYLQVSWRYLMGVIEIFDACPGDIYLVH